MKPFLLSIFFLFSLSIVSALYTPSFEVTSWDFKDFGSIDGSDKDFVYNIKLTDYPIVTVTLSGGANYAPKLYLFDPETGSFVFQKDGKPGETVSYTYTHGMTKAEPQEMYAIVVNHGTPGMTYNFAVSAVAQNDAGKGRDAPKRFSDGLLITPGSYQAHLGGGDLADHYSMELEQGETVSFSITPVSDAGFTFKLVDSSLFTKIDTAAMLSGGASLKTQYTAQVDQVIFFGVEGGVPYTLLVESSDQPASSAPVIPEPVIVVPEPSAPPVAPPVPEVEEEDPQTMGLLIIVLAVILLVVLGISMYSRNHKGGEKKAKK